MKTQNLLYAKSIPINDYITVNIPTVGEILDDEDSYFAMVTILTAQPIDLMVQLDDIGVDFSTINDYELFLIMFDALRQADTSLIFGDLDLSPFHTAINQQNGNVILINELNGIVIDRAIYSQIGDALRKINHFEKDTRKPANGEAKKFMIERARRKMKRDKNKKQDSQLEKLIVAMVNAEQYSYRFDDTRDLTIYQFQECVRQVIKKNDYNNRMHGIYSGTVSAKDMRQDDLNWLVHK